MVQHDFQIILMIVWIIILTNQISEQLDACLKQNGCRKDECCFNIHTKTGPICESIPGCVSQFKPDCCKNSRPVYTDYGIMYGYAISLDEKFGYQDSSRRFLQIWRGIPYAQPPTRENNLRFRRPMPLVRSHAKYDATYYRASCAQPNLDSSTPFAQWSRSAFAWSQRFPIQQLPKNFDHISEDCLYLNVYNLNDTTSEGVDSSFTSNKRYPIVVIFDGFDHITGTANRYPGHVLAQLGLVVVQINYRLGPFGYLATTSTIDNHYLDDLSNERALGNYALWDQIKALEFIHENANKFQGDVTQITLIGHGSAAADVALHLLSEKSGLRSPPLFHQAILMSGSDQVVGGFVQTRDEASTYAKQFAYQVGCDSSNWQLILSCLRSRTATELAAATSEDRMPYQKPKWNTKPWAPTIDGDLIKEFPKELWTKRKFASIPVIGGITTHDGAFDAIASIYRLKNIYAENHSDWHFFPQRSVGQGLSTILPIISNESMIGLSETTMRQAFLEIAKRDSAKDPVGVANALTFEYTDWGNPYDNNQRWNNFISAWTDRLYGSGIVETLRSHSDYQHLNNTQFYVFGYKSRNDKLSNLLGAYHGSELQYLYGLPRLQQHLTKEELINHWQRELDIIPPHFEYTHLDFNITDYWLSFIANFAKTGNATPIKIRNLTWDTYRADNRTYLWINLTENYHYSTSHRSDIEILGLGGGFDLRQNYRVHSLAYWTHLYQPQLDWLPRFKLPTPTPGYIETYRIASGCLAGLMCLCVVLILALLIMYYRKRKLFST